MPSASAVASSSALPPAGAATRSNLQQTALVCLLECDPQRKVELTMDAAARFVAGELLPGPNDVVMDVPVPGRPARPRLVAPRELPRRGLGSDDGRAAFLHAIAHIEFNAINLAWDAVYRFRGMPDRFHADFVGIAADEARHFELLRDRLEALGASYGDFDAHNGLWEMAVATADDCMARMALVPRVLEARGLDVTPGMIERLQGLGDHASVAVLEVILEEEVPHVLAGTRWFEWCCADRGLDPGPTFLELLDRHAPTALRRPLNRAARSLAGFGDSELAALDARAT